MDLDRRKLAVILGRLGSDFDGEIVAAGRAASALLREARTTWFDVSRASAGSPRTTLPGNGERR
jgi:hypothetical protein